MISFLPEILQGPVSVFWDSVTLVWDRVWWIVVPLITLFIFWEFWVFYIQLKFIARIKWVLLEIKVPKNVLKTPKAMEQIFAAAHAPYSYGLRFFEKYWDGIVEYWMSFEIVGHAGESHFYLRLPKQFRNMMESAIYAQYPEAEITEAHDYMQDLPPVLPNKTYDIYGYELTLRKPSHYPLRTYPMFEEAVEERRIDTIAPLLETMSKLKEDEHILIQILARPAGDEWKKKAEEEIKKMAGLDEKKKSGWPPIFGLSAAEIVESPFKHPSLEVERKKDETRQNFRMLMMTPGQREVMEGIERKIAKLGFETTIRFIYVDKREAFSRDNVAAVTGFFRQFNTQDMNLLKPDKKTMTGSVHGLFKQTRLNMRRRVIHDKYKWLSFNGHKPILNIEELATIFHFPIFGVSPAFLEKIESRKGGPPARIPMIEE